MSKMHCLYNIIHMYIYILVYATKHTVTDAVMYLFTVLHIYICRLLQGSAYSSIFAKPSSEVRI